MSGGAKLPFPALPDAVAAVIGERTGVLEDIGCSGSSVVIYDDMVLKVEPVSGEGDRAVAMMHWLDGRLPVGCVPAVLCDAVVGGMRHLVMSRMVGKMACDAVWLDRPEALMRALAGALKRLWAVDVRGCPSVCDLDAELSVLRERVARGEAKKAPAGFASAEALLGWLENNRPREDRVLSHGDFCLPNVLFDGAGNASFIDLGGCGMADRYRDISLCLQSLRRNCNGFFGGAVRPAPDEQIFWDALGEPCDEAKLDYYLKLDRLWAVL